MSEPDFSRYTLALFKDGDEIETSDEPGLRPLVRLIVKHKGLVGGCELHDKIVGLASAKLVAASGMVDYVIAWTMSRDAESFLSGTGIGFEHLTLVDAIMNRDGSDRCPMELKALDIEDPEEFLGHMIGLMGLQGRKP